MKLMTKIYLDQDDTLFDFMKGLEAFNVKNAHLTKEYLHLPRNEWPKNILDIDKGVVDCMNEPGFFKDLPVMEGAKSLWFTANLLGDVYVLTAWPKTCNDVTRVAREKYTSIKRNFGEFPDSKFICCAREDKVKYATDTWYLDRSSGDRVEIKFNILIDDMKANIEAWQKAGGIGILFKDSYQAIHDLREVLSRAA